MKFARLLILYGLILSLTKCISADLGLVSAKMERVQIGFTRTEVESIMGMPQKLIVNPSNSDIAYAHYCEFGAFSDDDNGVFYFKDEVYRKITSISNYRRSPQGVWHGPTDGKFNCHSAINVNWTTAPTPPKLIAERRAIEQQRREVQQRREAQITVREYFIDGLEITHTQDSGTKCASGSDYNIDVKGSIGPDSSFALEELLLRSPNCLDENNQISKRTTVNLQSLGGYLKDGYLMGRLFREHDVETVIPNDSACASSCAVAYLGGVKRTMPENAIIMFHSPYLPDLNAIGERVANCEVGSETTMELLEYYQEMTSPEQGERLFDRTMSYCSAEDGWVLRGSAAGELFGVATQI